MPRTLLIVHLHSILFFVCLGYPRCLYSLVEKGVEVGLTRSSHPAHLGKPDYNSVNNVLCDDVDDDLFFCYGLQVKAYK